MSYTLLLHFSHNIISLLYFLFISFFFFFNDTPTTEIYTLSLHDALPICSARSEPATRARRLLHASWRDDPRIACKRDRKSTRLNSSHSQISYAVFCLKKKKKKNKNSSI